MGILSLLYWQFYKDIRDEPTFDESFRMDFLKTISEISEEDVSHIRIVRSEKIIRTLGECLSRCNYHELVHTGQFLAYPGLSAGIDLYGNNKSCLWILVMSVYAIRKFAAMHASISHGIAHRWNSSFHVR